MSVLFLFTALLSFFSGFDSPLLKEHLNSQLDQIEVCANGGCNH